MISSAPTILRPRVRIPSTPAMLFSICIIEIVLELLELEKNENKKKRPGLAHIFF